LLDDELPGVVAPAADLYEGLEPTGVALLAGRFVFAQLAALGEDGVEALLGEIGVELPGLQGDALRGAFHREQVGAGAGEGDARDGLFAFFGAGGEVDGGAGGEEAKGEGRLLLEGALGLAEEALADVQANGDGGAS